MHTLARNADSMPVKNKLLTMMQEAHARRDMQPGSPNPDPDAPCRFPNRLDSPESTDYK